MAWISSLDGIPPEEPEAVGPRGADGAGFASIVVSEACSVRQYVQLIGWGAHWPQLDEDISVAQLLAGADRLWI